VGQAIAEEAFGSGLDEDEKKRGKNLRAPRKKRKNVDPTSPRDRSYGTDDGPSKNLREERPVVKKLTRWTGITVCRGGKRRGSEGGN